MLTWSKYCDECKKWGMSNPYPDEAAFNRAYGISDAREPIVIIPKRDARKVEASFDTHIALLSDRKKSKPKPKKRAAHSEKGASAKKAEGGGEAKSGETSEAYQAEKRTEAAQNRRREARIPSRMDAEVSGKEPGRGLQIHESVEGKKPRSGSGMESPLYEAKACGFESVEDWYDYHEAMRALNRIRKLRN